MARKKTKTSASKTAKKTTKRKTSATAAKKTVRKKTSTKATTRKTTKKTTAKVTKKATTSGSAKSTVKKPKSVAASVKAKSEPQLAQPVTGSASKPPAPVPAAPAAVKAPSRAPAAASSREDWIDGNGSSPSEEELRKVDSGLSKKDLQYFFQMLLEKRREIVGDVTTMNADARKSSQGVSYEHMADVGSDNYEQEFTLGLVESETKLVHEIDDALQRIQKGIYGVCIKSGKPIGRPRLEAKPWAKYCIEVAREMERLGKM